MNTITKNILLLTVMTTVSFASQTEHLFEKGNKFYESKNYDSAVTYYEESLNQGIENSAIYYNLGNSYFRLKKSGKAILNYERARRLNPSDKDIESNLKFARLNITDRIPEPEINFFESVIKSLHQLMNLKNQLIVGVFLLFIISIFFSAIFFVKGNKRLWFTYGAILSSILLLTLGLSAGIKVYKLENHNYAIIMYERVDVKNEPSGSKTLFTLHEGTKIQIMSQDRNWYYVSLSNGVSGWLEESAVEKI